MVVELDAGQMEEREEAGEMGDGAESVVRRGGAGLRRQSAMVSGNGHSEEGEE